YLLVVCYLDLDRFKPVNDRYGHAAGDDLLVGTAAVWQARLRAQDLIGRAGGDEFVLLLPDTDLAGARHLLAELAEASTIGFSAGLALAGPDESLGALLRRADAGMYSVKRGKPGLEPDQARATVPE
ncbi:MAG TPA: GGDEF domain-containing protein, partial [Actinotalea sp.]|nr:GGDEF domain-containing protein [Actinotalea sp.]